MFWSECLKPGIRKKLSQQQQEQKNLKLHLTGAHTTSEEQIQLYAILNKTKFILNNFVQNSQQAYFDLYFSLDQNIEFGIIPQFEDCSVILQGYIEKGYEKENLIIKKKIKKQKKNKQKNRKEKCKNSTIQNQIKKQQNKQEDRESEYEDEESGIESEFETDNNQIVDEKLQSEVDGYISQLFGKQNKSKGPNVRQMLKKLNKYLN